MLENHRNRNFSTLIIIKEINVVVNMLDEPPCLYHCEPTHLCKK